jgi:hypothetical protein
MALSKIVIPPTTPGTSGTMVALNPTKPATVMVYTSGATSFGLEYTLDNPQTDPAPRWLVHPSMTGQSASGSALLTTPVQAVRLNIASNAAAVEFRVLQ